MLSTVRTAQPVVEVQGCCTKLRQKPVLPVSVGAGLVVEVVPSALFVCTLMLNGFMKPAIEDSKYPERFRSAAAGAVDLSLDQWP